MDARLERLVNCSHTVGSEEQKTVVILENSEEHRDQGVSLHVVLGTLRQEDVGLIQEKNTVPQVSKTEYVLER